MKELDKVRNRCASLEQALSEARSNQRACDKALQPLGARKRNKPPEILAQIQAEIDSLRVEKQEVIALQKELEAELRKLRPELERLERVETLNQQQAERDKHAATQHNGSGKRPTQGRDTTWRI